MRIYIPMTEAAALKALVVGFCDTPCNRGAGVWCEERPRKMKRAAVRQGALFGGPEGAVLLCTDVPEGVFRDLEAQEGVRALAPDGFARSDKDEAVPEGIGCRRGGFAVIPAAVLNRFGRPKVYDHEFLGASRAGLLGSIRSWEATESFQSGNESARLHVQSMCAAITFLDAVGWQTPVRLREEAPEECATPEVWCETSQIEPREGE